MALRKPLPAPDGFRESLWSLLMERQPGVAAAHWLASHQLVELEEEGENRGQRLRDWLPYKQAVDGLPYCARLLIAVLDAAGAERVSMPGKHWFWHNGRVATFEKAHKANGTWLGPNVAPRNGMIVFHDRRGASDKGNGGHVDIVLSSHFSSQTMEVVGANVGDTIKVRELAFGHPTISGFGYVRPA